MGKVVLMTSHDLDFPLREGLRKQVWEHAVALKKKRYTVEVRCFSKQFRIGNKKKVKNGITIIEGNALSILNVKTDILHIFDCPNPTMTLMLKFVKYKKAFVTMTDGELCRFWTSTFSKTAIPLIKEKVDAIFVQTKYQKKLAQKYFKNIHIVPPLIAPFKKKGSKTKHPSILFMSHFSKDKGIYEIVDAFNDIYKKFPTAKLIVSDSGVYKKNKAAYEHIKKLHNKNIIVKGPINPEQELSKSWIYVYPVLKPHNTFSIPLSLFEAQRTHTAFICSDFPAIQEYVKKEFLVKPTRKNIAQKLSSLLHKYRKIKIKDAIKKVDNTISIQKVIAQYKK